MSIITLLTDFGARDGFVGVVKGVILSLNPAAQIVDIAHEVPPGDINAGAFVLAQSCNYFSPETIHVVVIDPGVGSARKALCVRANSRYFLAPDNGVLQWVFAAHPDAVVIELTNEQYFLSPVSNTFHGRDIFAPVAAHLSLGVAMSQLGSVIKDFQRGNIPVLRQERNRISGEILYIDHFGNLVTNIPAERLQKVNIDKIVLPRHTISCLSPSYQSEGSGPVALIGSHGFLEIALYGQNAGNILQYRLGAVVEVYFRNREKIE